MASAALSVQLYTVREPLAADLDGTLARLAGMGLTQVEAFDFLGRAPELKESFAKNGLVAKTGHAPLLSDGGPDQSDVFKAATTLGLDIVIDPFVAPERWFDQDAVTDTANRINAAAKAAADHGLVVGYHNHSQEFVKSFDGVTAYEYFVGLLSDEVVLELDLYWAATGEQDVVPLLGRLGDRVKALHMKDGKVGPNPFVPGVGAFDAQDLNQQPAGKGEIPLLDYLAASPSTEYAIIEFDAYNGDIFEGVQTSVEFLNANGLK